MPPERARRRPACRECRLQKVSIVWSPIVLSSSTPHWPRLTATQVKCNAATSNPCTRCRRMQLECVIAPTPASRRTKSQLQRELEDFRRRAERLDRDESNDSRSNSPTRQSGVDVDGVSASASASVPFMVADSAPAPLFVPALTPASEGIAGLQPQTSPSVSTRGNNHQPSISQDHVIEHPTTSQIFDGQDVAGRKIQDCFNLYDSHSPVLVIYCQEFNANFQQLLHLICSIPTSFQQCYSQSKPVLCTITFLVVGHCLYRQQGLFWRSNFVRATCLKN